MNDFFKDYICNPEQMRVLQETYKGVFAILNSNLDQVSRDSNISNILTYRVIPFQRIDITNSMYTLPSLLNNVTLLTSMGIDPASPYEIKKRAWDNLSIKDKATYIDIAGYSIEFVSLMQNSLKENTITAKFDVIDFELTDMQNRLLIKNVDYMFFDNKLVLLHEISADEIYQKKYMFIRNMRVDIGMSDDMLGESLNIPYSKEFTKTDYNETLKSFVQAAAGGPTINNLEHSLNRYKVLEGVRVYDRYNATTEKKRFWGNGNADGELTNFDFLVSLPISYVHNTEKLEYIRSFFNQIKPAYTNFIFSPEFEAFDALRLKYKPFTFKTSGSMTGILDLMNKADTQYHTARLKVFEPVQLLTGVNGTGDDGYIYDDNNYYDVLALTDGSVSKQTTHIAFDSLLLNKMSKLLIMSTGLAIKDNIKHREINKYNPKHTHKDILTVKSTHLDYKGKQLVRDTFNLRNKDLKARKDISANMIDVLEKQTSILKATAKLEVFEGIQILNSLSGNRDDAYITDANNYYDKMDIFDGPIYKNVEKILYDKMDFSKTAQLVKHKQLFNPIDNIVVKKEGFFFDYVVELSDTGKLSDMGTVNSLGGDIKDSIKDNTRENIELLNATSAYDKIGLKEDTVNKKTNTSCYEKVYTAPATNIVMCDSVFCFDSNDQEDYRFDTASGELVGVDTFLKDAIGIRLIPKAI